MKQLNFFLLICIIFASCNDSAISYDEAALSKLTAMNSRVLPSFTSYNVDETLVRGFIHLTRPNDTIQTITPIVRSGDNVAYLVQFSQGWELVSGDTRMTPRLAYSETGTFDMDEYENSGIGGIEGMLNLVEEKKCSTDTTLNATWTFLLPKHTHTSVDNGISPYGDVDGMWLPVDTQYVDNGDYVPHILKTRWGQNSPYNDICKKRYLGTFGEFNSFVGCGPVACGQIIYHYLKSNNPHAIAIPINHNSNDFHIIFSNFSTSQWSNLTTANQSLSTYLIYLGQDVMGAEYIPYLDQSLSIHREVGVDSAQCRVALDWAHLQYNQATTYVWQNIVSSLQASRPVLVLAYDSSRENGHAFIIDALNIHDSRLRITYEWHENYHPDFWELERNPSWMFNRDISFDGKEYTDTYQEDIFLEYNYSVAMNWGYADSASDNVYYTLCNGHTTLSPSWTVNGTSYQIVDKMFYNIRQ